MHMKTHLRVESFPRKYKHEHTHTIHKYRKRFHL